MSDKRKKRENIEIVNDNKCKGCSCKPNDYCEVQPKLAKFCKVK